MQGQFPTFPFGGRVRLEPPRKSGVAAACTIPLCLETSEVPRASTLLVTAGTLPGQSVFPPRFWWVSERGNRSRWWGSSRAGVVTERTWTSSRWHGLGAIECPGRFLSCRENRTVVKKAKVPLAEFRSRTPRPRLAPCSGRGWHGSVGSGAAGFSWDKVCVWRAKQTEKGETDVAMPLT